MLCNVLKFVHTNSAHAIINELVSFEKYKLVAYISKDGKEAISSKLSSQQKNYKNVWLSFK